ncbi:hypothetical protein PFISCL1PPCAC_24621 [Pristionchus fissidentatus]|uniref:Uncharacterized protein n=1 Tax=Pristionchus fissidentatus TaxID=1538716 RepID=A0AAV5WUF7_9BILA|nr:hypothetical protein PFISCL1PPCAC_24621 [Pristionchus fissidentatus]
MIPLLLLLPTTALALGDIWCQSGGRKGFTPTQCDLQTLECYKFVCMEARGDDADFTSRGCGVSLTTTATGLPNESCYQSMSICETLGGKGECHICSNKHLCNAVALPSTLSITVVATVIITILRL